MNGVRGRQRGFSLIELMVALVITMMTALLMFQTMTLGDGSSRTARSGNEAMRAGTMALDELSYLVRMAGMGLSQTPGAFGCQLNAYRDNAQILPSGATLPAPFDIVPTAQFRVAPIMAFDGGDGPDVLLVMSGNSASANIAMPRAVPQVGGTSVTVPNTVGFRQNDFVLLTQLNVAGQLLQPGPCFLTQINQPAASMGADGYVNANPITIEGNTYSAPNGAIPAGQNFAISTLGTAPNLQLIGVRRANGRSDLVSYDLLTGVGPTVLAENVADLQVLYGVDLSTPGATRSLNIDFDFFGDGTVDDWVAPTGDWSAANLWDLAESGAASWNGPERQRRIKSVRLALITTDGEVSRRAVERTDNTLRIFDNAISASNTALRIEHPLTDGGRFDRRSRYQVFETIIPVRNLTGGLSPVSPSLYRPVSAS